VAMLVKQTGILKKVDNYTGYYLYHATEIVMDAQGFKLIEFFGSAAHAGDTFAVYYSYDNSTWYQYYLSSAPETLYNDVIQSAARYFKMTCAVNTSVMVISVKR